MVIPARRASTRLPQKLLLAESGRPLLAHTIERCLAAHAPEAVIVAVDDPELERIAREAGAEAVRTPSELASGSDRVWAAVERLPQVQRIVNVQGDEPEVDPEAVDAVCGALAAGSEVVTLASPWPEGVAPEDPAAVKVVCAPDGRALYFSRAAIPHRRNSSGRGPLLHVGVYGYTRAALERFASHPPTPLERTEGLEQLRFLERGESVLVIDWPRSFPGIDTRQDYEAFLRRKAQRT